VAHGRLVVFEGPEGAGKSTQVGRLGAWMREHGIDHLMVREPGGTAASEKIRALLLDPAGEIEPRTEALLFMASRAELVSRVIAPALERGTLVIADRFFMSTYAYQIGGRGLPAEEIRSANAFAAAGIVPDLTLLFMQSYEEGLARADRRGTRDRMERMGDDFHRRVGEAFARFADPAWLAGYPECGRVVQVDAGGTEEEVFRTVLAVLHANGIATIGASAGSQGNG
jgi:dTMP kinase